MSTLLVLEDESALMMLLRHMLKTHSLIEAASAEQALRLFDANRLRIDLLFADVTLPASSGIEVALRLRAEIPGLPVILTSGCPVSGWSGRDSADLERLGADSVTILAKPYHARVISNIVCDLLRTPQTRKSESGITEETPKQSKAVA